MHLTDLKEEEIEIAIKVGISKNNYYHSQLKFIIYILMGHIRLAMRSVILYIRSPLAFKQKSSWFLDASKIDLI